MVRTLVFDESELECVCDPLGKIQWLVHRKTGKRVPIDGTAERLLDELGIDFKYIEYAGGDDGSPSQLGSTAKPIRGLIRRNKGGTRSGG